MLPRFLGLLAILLLAACTANPAATPPTSNASAEPPTDSASPGASLPGSTIPPLDSGPDKLVLNAFAAGLDSPISLTNAGDGSNRLYANEQAGRIRIVEADGTLRPQPFLDITDRISSGGERGLLGLAFHPDFEENHRFFVDYTASGDGHTVIAEYTAADDGLSADPASERVLLTVDQPYANHNGGQLAFGPDGDLYIGLGDGGSGGDPQGNGQNTQALLGKVLRIDVDAEPAGGKAYAIPDDNPFASGRGAPEVWAYGLRNPWRFSFDREQGDLYIADVGQGSWEEIDRQPSDSPGGENYGWNVMEGRHCYRSDNCDPSPYVPPIAEYSHDQGCSVTGGYVYRGTQQPDLVGIYVFADYCSGIVFTLQVDEGTTTPKVVAQTELGITSFGESEDGEIYAVDQRGGGVYHVALPG
ncbi:MAG TPA: PQQ-dependent sugar dehydrogenase [Candidatus Limnocylindria bacterium]|nr:PQQ-dependent sugar dehydrogenase [Candidatus Limnocylindria bacterium]